MHAVSAGDLGRHRRVDDPCLQRSVRGGRRLRGRRNVRLLRQRVPAWVLVCSRRARAGAVPRGALRGGSERELARVRWRVRGGVFLHDRVCVAAGVHAGDVPAGFLLRGCERARSAAVLAGVLRERARADGGDVQRAVHERLLLRRRLHVRYGVRRVDVPGGVLLRMEQHRGGRLRRREVRRDARLDVVAVHGAV